VRDGRRALLRGSPLGSNPDISLMGDIRGSQRDVSVLADPLRPRIKAQMRRGASCVASANEYRCAHGAQRNFGDLTSYLTYG
jgi:hypothetical protein